MRYAREHKAAVREKIVATAAAAFRERGIDGIGVADVMRRAGLTHGGFYSHFDSKEALVRAAVAEGFRQGRLRAGRDAGKTLEQLVRSYLSRDHRDQPGTGCPAAAFVGEIARRPGKTRDAFALPIDRMVGLVEGMLPGRASASRRRTARGIAALLVGTLQLARAARDAEAADGFLQAGIAAALALAKK